MIHLTDRKIFVVCMLLTCIIAFFTTHAMAEEPKKPTATSEEMKPPPEKMEVSGKRYDVRISEKTVKIDDVEGHYVVINESIGADIKSGAQNFSTSVSDTIMGNGTSFGYFKIVMPDGAIAYGRADGKISTVLSPSGKPITSVEGTWTVADMPWAGKLYEGNGTFSSRVIGPGISSTQYEGELRQKKE